MNNSSKNNPPKKNLINNSNESSTKTSYPKNSYQETNLKEDVVLNH